MSVYTTVPRATLNTWLGRYRLGGLLEFQGIAAGIENTNYFVTTTAGRYVLTLFERLGVDQLPFYLGLMTHLAERGIPCPKPVADRDGEVLSTLCGKPAALVTRLPGRAVDAPSAAHCAEVGRMLALMHRAGSDYPRHMPNPRGLSWWQAVAPELLPLLPPAEADLLRAELDLQARFRFDEAARGAIHADLFRDNVLFEDARLGGVIDFYFACTDVLLYDLAITVNDWCNRPDASLDPARTEALLAAYRAVRPIDATERELWPILLRAGALRFWISRLDDYHRPRPGELTYAKDPAHFRRILEARIAGHSAAAAMLA